jgi:hypothetical protein
MTGYTLVGVNGQDEGSNLGFGAYLNFTGAGVTASISGDVLTVNIPGGGAGGTPALPFTSVQYNNAGAFGGSANFTWNGTGLVVTDGAGTTDTLSPGSLLFTTAGTGTVSVKTGGGSDGPLNLDILDFQINGASGLAGQVLTSAGPGASPTWAAVPAASGWTDGGTAVYLTTATDDVSIGNNTPVTNRKLSVYNTGTDLGISVVALASTNNVIETFVSGEANLRWSVNGTGATLWGAGGASALDTRLYRSAANTLTLDNGAAGAATLAPGADSVGAIGTASLRWSTVVGNAHNVFTALGDANPTATLTSGTLRFGAGGGAAVDTRIYRSGAQTLTFDNGAAGSAVWVFLGSTTFQRTQYQTVTTAASPYVVLGTDNQVFANPGAAQTITLPAASAAMLGRTITVKRVNTSVNVVTVNTAGGNIDGAASRALAGGTFDSLTVTCALVGGVYDWYII